MTDRKMITVWSEDTNSKKYSTKKILEISSLIILTILFVHFFVKQSNIQKTLSNKLNNEIQSLVKTISEHDQNRMLSVHEKHTNSICEFNQFKWSPTLKQSSITVSENSASIIKSMSGEGILLEPLLLFDDSAQVKLKIVTKNNVLLLHIVDLNVIQSSNFHRMWDNGGASTQYSDGRISETGNAEGIQISEGDIIELQWDGPQRKFTTLNLTTKKEYSQTVYFNADAQIYLGVSIQGGTRIDII